MLEQIKEMNLEELEARKSEISAELADADAPRLEELRAEVDAIEARKAEIEKMASDRAELEKRVMVEGTKIESFEELEILETEERKEENPMEIRNTPEYIEAFANYVKTGKDEECRALLTTTATADTGYVPVPELVEETVRTAWEREGIMSRVKKSYMKGILKVGFELSADGAVVHSEGADAPDEEVLTLGIVTLTPQSIKKWITISDEVLDMTSGAFLTYIYDEVAYQIAKKAASEVVSAIEACATTASSTGVGVPEVASTEITQSLIATALGYLADGMENPVIILNRQTEAAFKGVQYAGNYAADIFEGLERVYCSDITAFSAATTGVTYAIVGDLGAGILANFPNGDEIKLKFDDLSLAEKDLVKIVGREYIGIGVVQPGAFVKITA